MFSGLIREAKEAASGLLLKYVARASVAVPFAIALGFALAATTVMLVQTFGQVTAYWIMAAGLAVVATDVDGAAEAVVDGATGLLCRPRDVHGLTRSCLALLAAPGMAAAMGARGRSRAQAFDEGPMLAALDAFYAELTGRA